MSLRDVWQSCVRRWYIVLSGLLLVLAGSAYLFSSSAVTYEATASVVLVPPTDPEHPTANRYLGLGGLTQASDILTRSMMSDSTHQAVEQQVPLAVYEVLPDRATAAPILLITVSSPDKVTTNNGLQAVLQRVPVNLTAMQENLGISGNNRIISMKIAETAEPEAITKSRDRTTAAFAAMGLISVAALTAAVDGILLRRKDTQRLDVTEDEDEPSEPPPPHDDGWLAKMSNGTMPTTPSNANPIAVPIPGADSSTRRSRRSGATKLGATPVGPATTPDPVAAEAGPATAASEAPDVPDPIATMPAPDLATAVSPAPDATTIEPEPAPRRRRGAVKAAKRVSTPRRAKSTKAATRAPAAMVAEPATPAHVASDVPEKPANDVPATTEADSVTAEHHESAKAGAGDRPGT